MLSSTPELGVQSQEVSQSTLDVEYYSRDSPVLVRRARAPSGDASGCNLLAAFGAPGSNAGQLAIVPTGFAPPDTDNWTEHLCPSDTAGGVPTVTSTSGADGSRLVLAGWTPYNRESESSGEEGYMRNCTPSLLKNSALSTVKHTHSTATRCTRFGT